MIRPLFLSGEIIYLRNQLLVVMKRLGLTLLIILSAAFNIEACHFPEKEVVEVDGIYYAFDANGWWVAGFKQEQDSVVLKHSVVINGKREIIEDIYIGYPMNGRTTTSPKVLVIPDGFKNISSLELPRLEKLYIPKTVSRTHDICTCVYANINCENLKHIQVDKQNKYLKSVDGVLFSKDGKNLYLYPSKKQGEAFEIPKRVEHILLGAFEKCQLERIYFPKSKKEMVYYYQFGYDEQYTDAKEALESMGFEDTEKIKFIGR